MAKLAVLAGATSQTVNVFIQDSSKTDGSGLAGLVFNSAGLTAAYALPKAAAVSITLATLAAVTSAYSSGGFKEIDSSLMPGWYRFDVPNAALAAASGRFVSIHLKGATNMAPCPLEIELTGWDNQDAVRGGLTALPNANAEAAGGLYTRGSGAGQVNQQANGQIDANVARWLNTAPVTPLLAGVPIVDPSYVLRRATAQGGAASTITFDAGANATDNYYRGTKVAIISGTGAGQARVITAYVGATKVATVTPAWITNPDATSVFENIPIGSVNVEAWESVVPNALNNGLVQSDVERWLNGVIPAPNVTGVPIIDLKYILGTVLTETAGQIAGAFKKLFDVAAPVLTALSVNQTGDNFTRLGAPAGASIAADLAEIEAETDGIGADTPGTTTLLSRIPGTVQPQTGDSYARLGAPAGASIAADLAEIEAETDTIGSDTSGVTTLLARIPGTVQPQTGDAYARLGAPAGASIAADLAEIEGETDTLLAGVALTTGERTSLADAILDRDMSLGVDSGSSTVRTMRQALRFLRNRWTAIAGVLTVYKEDDTVTSWTSSLTTDATATAITGSDPAG